MPTVTETTIRSVNSDFGSFTRSVEKTTFTGDKVAYFEGELNMPAHGSTYVTSFVLPAPEKINYVMIQVLNGNGAFDTFAFARFEDPSYISKLAFSNIDFSENNGIDISSSGADNITHLVYSRTEASTSTKVDVKIKVLYDD